MSDLDQIKSKIDIVSLISEYVPLKKTGTNFKGLCPFHSEKTPSFVVSSERQIWHCFGGCQDGGDIFKFIMRIENLDFPEALKMLAKKAGVTLTSKYSSQTTDLKEKIYQVNSLAAEYYHYILTKHDLGQKARDYLTNRLITTNSLTVFSLGYAPSSWDSLSRFLLKKNYTYADLEIAGLVSRSSSGKYFDRFRGRLMFPLKDHYGQILGFAGRLLDPDAKEAKYINTSETPVYIKGNLLYGLDVAKDAIKKTEQAVIVEGEIDMIQSFQSGVKQTVAIKGSALTEGQVNLLKRYTQNINLALDADFAGNEAVHRGIQTADAAGLDIRVVVFGDAKDPDELIKLDPDLWRKAVEKSIPFYDYVINSALSKYDSKTATGAKQIVAECSKFLAPIDNLVVRSHYLKKLASALNVDTDTLENQIDKEFRKLKLSLPNSLVTPSATPASSLSRQETISRYLLSLLLQSKKPQNYVILFSERLGQTDFSSPALGQIFAQLCEFTKTVPQFSLNAFVDSLPSEYSPLIDELCLVDLPVNPEDDGLVLEEVTKLVWELRELSLRSKLKEITGEIKLASEEQSPELENKFQDLSLQLGRLIEEKQLIQQTREPFSP